MGGEVKMRFRLINKEARVMRAWFETYIPEVAGYGVILNLGS